MVGCFCPSPFLVNKPIAGLGEAMVPGRQGGMA